MEGKLAVGGTGQHVVTVGAGQTVRGINFGNIAVPDEVMEAADVNDDDVVNAADIDLLAAAVQGGKEAEEFDVNQDGKVDRADIDTVVEKALNTVYGDSNLDGVFNSSDLVFVFQKGKYEDDIPNNAGWEDGDWNGDGDFTTKDMVFVFEKGTYETNAAVAAAVDQIWSLDNNQKAKPKSLMR